MTKLETILEKIENKKITIAEWLLGFTGIILVRFIFESLSSSTNSGVIPSDIYTIIHTWLYFLVIALGLSLIVGYFTKKYSSILKIILFGLPIIWLGPIIDIVISLGKGYKIAYIQDTGNLLLRDFFTFFGPNFTNGATYGLRIEMAIILIGVGLYVWSLRKNIWQSVLAVIISYTFIFLSFVVPVLIYTLTHLSSPDGTVADVVRYIAKIIFESNIAHNTFRDGLSYVSLSRLAEMGFDKLLSQIFFISSVIFSGLLFWRIDSKKFLAVIKNSRPERAVFFLCLVGVGVVYAYARDLGRLSSLIDILSLVCLALAWTSAWMHAVHINDLEDVEIDKISNSKRPLVQGVISLDEVKNIGYIWLAVAFVGAWSAGFAPFYMILVFISASFIYSSKPLRLRVFPILSSFIISIACLVSVLAGFFFISLDKRMSAFPAFLSIGTLIIFTLIINIKDMKDAEGDKADDIQTLPTIFGENAGKAVGLCFALGVLLIPFLMSFYIFYITAIPTAIIGYRIISRKPFVEKNVFILGLVFLLSSLLLFGVLFWLAKTLI